MSRDDHSCVIPEYMNCPFITRCVLKRQFFNSKYFMLPHVSYAIFAGISDGLTLLPLLENETIMTEMVLYQSAQIIFRTTSKREDGHKKPHMFLVFVNSRVIPPTVIDSKIICML